MSASLEVVEGVLDGGAAAAGGKDPTPFQQVPVLAAAEVSRSMKADYSGRLGDEDCMSFSMKDGVADRRNLAWVHPRTHRRTDVAGESEEAVDGGSSLAKCKFGGLFLQQ